MQTVKCNEIAKLVLQHIFLSAALLKVILRLQTSFSRLIIAKLYKNTFQHLSQKCHFESIQIATGSKITPAFKQEQVLEMDHFIH